jgi:multiple sugar transport system permease protein
MKNQKKSGYGPKRVGIGKMAIADTISGYAFIGPWLLGFLAFSLIPIATSIYFSFTQYDLLSDPIFIGIQNFKEMLGDSVFWKSLGVTFYYVLFAVPLRLIFALFIAMLFNRKAKFLGVYQAIYYFPSIIGGSIAVAVMWRRLFKDDGAINALLAIFGYNSHTSWIGNPNTAIWTLILLAAWQFGSSMLIFLAGLKQIPESYYESADIDGASPYQKFFRITIPQLSPVIFFNLIMQTINGFTVFTQAFVISGGNGDPMNNTLVYALYLYKKSFEYSAMGYGCAMAWVLVFIIAVFTFFIFKSSSSWVYYESKEN